VKRTIIWMAAVGIIFGSVLEVLAATDEKGPVNALTVSIPNVVGMLGGKGRQAIESAGLKWAYASQGIPVTDPNKNATVASQSPAGGARVPRGSTVTLTLNIFVERPAESDQKNRVNLPGRP
jgi:beta-lactam-binding protein with PASTA domain